LILTLIDQQTTGHQYEMAVADLQALKLNPAPQIVAIAARFGPQKYAACRTAMADEFPRRPRRAINRMSSSELSSVSEPVVY
jgi:hypothetical protein